MAPARTASRETGSHRCHCIAGYSCFSPAIWRANVGEVDGAGKDAEAFAVGLAQCVALGGKNGQQRRPGLRLALMDHAAAAVGIVETQDFRLADGAGAAQAGGMQRIALDLDGPAVVVAHQDARA